MSKEYACKKCGKSHVPPTGKRCTQEREIPDSANNDEVLGLLSQLKQQFDTMQVQMQTLQAERTVAQTDDQQAIDSDNSEQEEGATADGETDLITPETLRDDVRAMERAARRIARFKEDDSDDSEEATTTRTRSKGKKSGSYIGVSR